MKKNRKMGISLIALICTICVMLILATTVTVSFNNISVSTRKKEFANEIYSIQKLVDEYNFKNNKYPVKDTEITINVSIDTEQFAGEDSSSVFKEIDLYEANVNETNRGQKKDSNADDIYVVSEKTGRVYYKKGQKIKNQTYYTLTDDLKKEIGILR